MDNFDAYSKPMKKDISTRADIEQLVQRFYEEVLKDPLLAPAFERLDMPRHFPIMYNFWSSLLLDDHQYTGNAFEKHLRLKLTPEMFKRWLEIFEQTVNGLFVGSKAELALNRAHSIAFIFESKLREAGKLG
jgi:hemoglobin